MKKRDYIVRILSVAPVLAAVMLIVLFVTQRDIFRSTFTFAIMLVTLGILPLSAYPLQRFIPKFKDGGRRAQRTLAMIFAVIGYVICTVLLLLFKATKQEMLICSTYLISGILILIINKVFKLHASGHGCGVCGPIPILVVLGSYIAAAVYALSAVFVCISSIRSKRHTFPEFLGGAAVSVFTAVFLRIILL